MTFGVTAAGFVRKRFEDCEAEVDAFLRAKISKHLQLTEKTALGNIKKTLLDQVAELWEVAEADYHAFDPDNSDDAAFVALCELTGTKRRGATKGLVTATCNFAALKNYAPGDLVAHVAGKPTNRWVNRDSVASVAAGNYPVVFESESYGAGAVAESGTLTVIAQSIDGWISVTNAVAAEPGLDLESIEDLAVRREQELERAGSGPLPAIRAAVSQVEGVQSVKAAHNTTDVYAAGLPPHSFRIVVWDGIAPAADNDEIAQAIQNGAPAGIDAIGSVSGTATDVDGVDEIINFDRATQVPIHVEIEVQGSALEADVVEAILQAGVLGVGETVISKKIELAALNLPGVEDIIAFNIGIAPMPLGASNIVPGPFSIALFDASRIAVSVTP